MIWERYERAATSNISEAILNSNQNVRSIIEGVRERKMSKQKNRPLFFNSLYKILRLRDRRTDRQTDGRHHFTLYIDNIPPEHYKTVGQTNTKKGKRG